MIKVLEHGAKKVTCPYCKAKLQYEQEDVMSEKCPNGKCWIICPDCERQIWINGYKECDEYKGCGGLECVDLDL